MRAANDGIWCLASFACELFKLDIGYGVAQFVPDRGDCDDVFEGKMVSLDFVSGERCAAQTEGVVGAEQPLFDAMFLC